MKKIATTMALAIATFAAQAQKEIDTKGDMYFKAMCYPRAFAEYIKEYAKKPDNADLLLKITKTALLDENPRDTAVFFIEKYMQMESETVEAYYLAAQAHYHAHHFSKAQKYLNEYTTMATNKDDMAKAEELQSWIRNAQRMMKDTLKCTLYNLGDMINTTSSEINPFITDDDNTIIFSCDEKYNSNDVVKYFNIKYAENVDLSWTKSKAMTGNVNTLYDEYVTSANKNHIFYCNNSEKTFALYEAEYKGNGRLGDGMKMAKAIDRKGDEVAATLTNGGDTIIFSTTNAKGKLDLYYSIRFKDEWGVARPLPGELNDLDSDDNYPTLSRDGKRLYFASNREGSMGGYDIFYSDLNVRTGEWGKPVQMKYPINDTYDNLTISFASTGRYAYISSIRKEGYGSRDIYAVVFDKINPTTAIMRCFAGVKASKRPLHLTQQPKITVTDSKGKLVSRLRMNLRTSTFILALDPGKYTLTIESPEAKTYIEQIVVEEKVYDKYSIEKVFILEPKN